MHEFILTCLTIILIKIVLYLKYGLILVIEMLFPTVEHRYCVKHIYNNFKVDHKGLELKDALWECARATTVRKFEKRMQQLKDLDVKAWEYLACTSLQFYFI